MKRIIKVFIVIFLLIAFVACQSTSVDQPEVTTSGSKTSANDTTTNSATTNSTTTKETTTSEDTTEENPFAEFMEITWLQQLNSEYQEGRWDELELEEKFNVDLQVWAMDSRLGDKMAALVAAGEIPDYMFMAAAPRQPADMYEEKLIRSIPLSFYRDYLPGYYELLQKLPIGLSYNLVPGKTDEYLGFTQIDMRGCQYFYDSTCVNLDWLENIGYEIEDLQPITQASESFSEYNDNIYFAEGGFTFEEMNDILQSFTEDDPDGNGMDDTFGMLYMPPSANQAWTNQTQWGLFGFVDENNYLYKDPVSGNIVPKYAYTPYRDYYKWISESLAKGYMGQLEGYWYDSFKALTATGKYGIMSVCGVNANGMHSEANKQLPPMNYLLTVDPDARFVIGPMFSGPNGDACNRTYNVDPYGVGSWRVYMVGEQVTDEKLQRICQILQYTMFSGIENYTKFFNGLEGVHFKWSGEKYKSNMIATPTAELPPEYRGLTSVFTFIVTPSPITQFIREAKEYDNWHFRSWLYVNDLLKKYAINPAKYVSAVYMGQELFDEYTKLTQTYPEINVIVNDFVNRAITGKIADFNTEWQQYIEQLYSAGLELIIEEVYNNPEFKAYDPGEKFLLVE